MMIKKEEEVKVVETDRQTCGHDEEEEQKFRK